MAPALGLQVVEGHAELVGEYPRAAHMDLAAAEADRDHGSAPMDGPNRKLRGLVGRDLGAVVVVEEHPTEEPQVHEQMQVGRPGDGRLVGLERSLDSVLQPKSDHSAEAVGEL